MTAFAPLLDLLSEVPDPRRGQGQMYKLPFIGDLAEKQANAV